MLLYILTHHLNVKKENLSFLIIISFLTYFIILQFIELKYMALIIPYDLFLSVNSIPKVCIKKKVKSKSSHSHSIRENLIDHLNIDKISITDTIDHTFKNLGITK